MAFVSVTYTFTSGTTADPGQVNTNFSNVIDGLTDGSKDLAVYGAYIKGTLTVVGQSNHAGGVVVDGTITSNILSVGQIVKNTINSGAIVQTATNTTVEGESGNADDLDTITVTAGAGAGSIIMLGRYITSGTITVKHNTGNIYCTTDKDLTAKSEMTLIYASDGYWHQTSYEANI